ncbi:hypothetical protein JIQ42_03934 [Leishmania sp. Namibia]|uniref:hypothetical protein n=1 Tax=Leishmania sp. Namibia TaxID=2802991 RepID=UPI001B7BF937|nr:hypothetical protein JIQ42_03934 [Leishmania sp. Namibia]
MHRNRIRVRPAGSSNGSNGTRSLPDIDFVGADESFGDRRAAAPRSGDSVLAARESHTWNAQSSSSPHDANNSGEGWRYARRIANLAYDTVSGVLDVLRARAYGEASASKDKCPPVQKVSSSMAPPDKVHIHAANPVQTYSVARQPCDEAHVADTVELRQSRRSAFHHQLPTPQAPASEPAPQTRDAPLVLPPVREAPQCQITVNQYFAAPERSIYPMVFANSDHDSMYRSSPAYPPRVSLLTARPSLQDHAKRPRLAGSPAASAESRARKAPKKTTFADASQASSCSAPSAIPVGSQENSLKVPIASLATARMLGKANAANEDEDPAPAMSAVSLVDMPMTKMPLFSGASTASTAAAAPKAFVFGATPAAVAPKHSVTAAPAFGTAKTSSFVKPGPPAVIPDDSGFAPGADSDDDKGTQPSSESAVPTKATFSFSPIGAKPAFGGTSSLATGAPANPFSFSAKPAEATPATAAPAFGTAKMSSFVKPGPPAVIPDDSGFAPGADSDDDKGTQPSSESAVPTKATFSFSPIGAKPAFGGTSSLATGAPANPFSFSAKPAEATPATAAPAFGTAKTSSFVKPGPPAVIPDDSGFAPGADSDDDKGRAKESKADSAGKGGGSGAFSFRLNEGRAKLPSGRDLTFGVSSPFGASAGASGTAAKPFSFSNSASSGPLGVPSAHGFSFATPKQ